MIRNVVLLLLLQGLRPFADAAEDSGNATKKFGDHCLTDDECKFEYGVCDKKCQCHKDYPVTNHIDKCGQPVPVNESCTFNEQCEEFTEETECKNGVCACLFDKTPIIRRDGKVECFQASWEPEEVPKYRDPTMIAILVAMILMFITICVVLRLFSRARWRENRTIFNTPNPRLMNASLLREHKDRRGSKASIRGPSRQSSMLSLKAPNSGSRTGSRTDIYGSKTSLHSVHDQNRSKVASGNDEKVVVDI